VLRTLLPGPATSDAYATSDTSVTPNASPLTISDDQFPAVRDGCIRRFPPDQIHALVACLNASTSGCSVADTILQTLLAMQEHQPRCDDIQLSAGESPLYVSTASVLALMPDQMTFTDSLDWRLDDILSDVIPGSKTYRIGSLLATPLPQILPISLWIWTAGPHLSSSGSTSSMCALSPPGSPVTKLFPAIILPPIPCARQSSSISRSASHGE
jgi:hypothetical protein